MEQPTYLHEGWLLREGTRKSLPVPISYAKAEKDVFSFPNLVQLMDQDLQGQDFMFLRLLVVLTIGLGKETSRTEMSLKSGLCILKFLGDSHGPCSLRSMEAQHSGCKIQIQSLV